MPDELTTGDVLSFGELVEALDGEGLMESESSRMIVPKKGGLFDSDGYGRVAIIRPCVSKGARIQGLPPIYTPQMLEAHAGVFNGWPMYIDHMAEEAMRELAEVLAEEGHELLASALQESRSLKEIGGRIIEAKWDPKVRFPDDAENGYQPGAVVGKYKPQRVIRHMLEDDPGILNVSINAMPSGATVGTAPWDSSRKGALIEGIRRKPMGSVDFVFKGGAGGRPLLFEEREPALAVSLLESAYDSGHGKRAGEDTEDEMSDTLKEKLSKAKNADDLRGLLREEAPHLVEALAPEKTEDEPAAAGLSEERLTEILTKRDEQLLEQLDERLEEGSESLEEKAQELVEERETYRTLADVAADFLREAEKNGLPHKVVEHLRPRYLLLPSGPSDGLLCEAETDGSGTVTKSAEDVLRERVKADVQEMVDMLAESGADPRVTGLAPTAPDEGGEKTGRRGERVRESRLEGFVRRSGITLEEEDEAGEDGKTKKGEEVTA